MKNFQQNLLVVLAAALCLLCAWQWYGQTLQRNQIQGLNQLVYEKSAAIQGYTNSLSTLDHQVAQMDARIAELKGMIKTNDLLILNQKRELSRLEFVNAALTNEIIDYTNAVATMQAKLKEAYDGVKKQNDTIKDLVAQRDELVQKLNDSVKGRNDVVNKYNELADRFQKLQSGNGSGK
jgi:chromosome segregation ATPase